MNCVCVCRCVYSAAVWYYNHLAGGMDIVMITEDQDAVAEYSSLHSGVYVISVQVCYHSHYTTTVCTTVELKWKHVCAVPGPAFSIVWIIPLLSKQKHK